MPASRKKRPTFQPLGPEYQILLKGSAWGANRSEGEQIRSIVQSRLMVKKDDITQMVEAMAEKAGIEPEELWDQIITGTAPTPDEIVAMITKRAASGGAVSLSETSNE